MACSSAPSRRPSSFDVFINFRGPDTRTNFVTLLYRALTKAKILTFIDSEELWEGEEICPSLVRAIRGSKISVPVMSKSYAHSKYCLLELAEIWECHLSQGQTILPVFIDVEPRDVRHQTGSFEGPFQEYQERYNFDDVERWKNALRKVGDLKGLPLKGNATIEDQSNLVELIVCRASRELNNVPLDECRHPVGIDSHIDILLPKLNLGSDEVRFVAICGMGGLGKTTIAKAVYNHISTSFNGSSFLSDVREKASKGDEGLVSLQNRLLTDILGKDQDISSASQGSKLIEKRLHKEKVLLILDDVDDYTQLDALAGGINWFGEGSRVIITTRYEHCLNVRKADRDIKIYEPEGLNSENSLQLLSLHAFSTSNPPKDYTELVREVVCRADGLPLTLEVLGSFLCDKSKEEWEDTLGGLKDILDNKVSGMLIRSYEDKVFARLMISYKKLSDNAKIIFLDIACYFIGWGVDGLIVLWEACELYPRLAIKELTHMHLLKIIDERISMHDELQFMGKRIVLMNSNGDHSKLTRLWSNDEISKVFEKHTATPMVEGILLPSKMHTDDLSFDDFAKMSKLRFLYLNYNNPRTSNKPITGEFSNLSSQLRLLRWYRCPLKILSTNFYHEELVHLDLFGSDINQAWNDRPQNNEKRFRKLKVLDLSFSRHFSVSSNFSSWFPCLERLDLHECRSLLQLPESICQMVSLKILNLNECRSFNKLPVSIGNLKHLVELLLRSTMIEELPDGVGQLEKLEKLDVLWCDQLARLPTSMGGIRRLPRLNLRSTMVLKLPDDFSKLSCLEVLEMSMAEQCEIGENRMLEPLQISESSFPCQLQELYLEGYMNLESLPRLPSTLTTLTVRFCDSLVRLPDLSNLSRLKKFLVHVCKNLEEIHCVEGTKSLELFSVSCCPKLTKLPDLSNLKKLWSIDVSDCDNLEEIQGVEGIESLKVLNVLRCQKLTQLPDFSNLKRLKKLCIWNCPNLEKIQCIEGAESLDYLGIRYCHKLTKLPDVSYLKRLSRIYISDCKNIEKFQCIEGAKSLKRMRIRGFPKLTKLPDISYLKRLSEIYISYCRNLEKIHCFEGAQSLRVCVFTGCHKLTEARRKIYGQGRLLDYIVKGVKGSNAIVTSDRGSPILCIVFASRYRGPGGFIFQVRAYIHRRGVRRIHFRHSIRVDQGQSEFTTSKGDKIYIHHFKGFNWFGLPLESNDAIEELTVLQHQRRVKFCKVLFEDKDSEQSSAKLVANFFRWSDGDNDVHDDDDDVYDYVYDYYDHVNDNDDSDHDYNDDDEVVEEEEGSDEEVEEEEGGLKAARNKNESCPDDDNNKRAASSGDCSCFADANDRVEEKEEDADEAGGLRVARKRKRVVTPLEAHAEEHVDGARRSSRKARKPVFLRDYEL